MTTPPRTRYMLDANAFDHVLDHAIDPIAVRRLGELFITTVQHGELLSVPDPGRRRRLLRVLSAIDPTVRPAFDGTRLHDAVSGAGIAPSGASSGTSRPGAARRGSRAAARASTRRKDVAIADVAALEGCTLITNDKGFRRRAIEAGLTALSCAEAFDGLDRLPPR